MEEETPWALKDEASQAGTNVVGGVGEGGQLEEEDEEPAWLVDAASALLRSLNVKGRTAEQDELSDTLADTLNDTAGLLRAALAQNARMQGVLQSQMEAEAQALQELHQVREALDAERKKSADLKQTVEALRAQLNTAQR